MKTPDPVVMSRVVADCLLSELHHAKRPERLSVLNVLRVLEMYGTGKYPTIQAVGIRHRQDIPDPDSLEIVEDYSRLQSALSLTHEQYLPGSSTGDFVVAASASLEPLLQDGDEMPPTENELAQAGRFLRTFSDALSTV